MVQPSYAVGSLVRVRGREWVVLPSGDRQVLRIRPLAGSEHETCSVFLPVEGDGLSQAVFPPPDPSQAGDFEAGKLLRNAVRMSLRTGAGPFLSLGKLSVTPRPYQFVPLIMGLRLDPVRLFIADDVGVGKTIEAGFIAAELLERGEVQRLCVLCPPHLCDQWESELNEKFHLDAHVLRAGTVSRLERALPRRDVSLYDYYRCLVISVDYIKGDRHRHEFLARCPDLVIVDEVHQCARPRGSDRRVQQQRYELISELARDPQRHLMFLTATPHSGIEESFQSILGLLDKQFEGVDIHSIGEPERARLARQFVQRRRADVQRWLGSPTPFPDRVSVEATYRLTPAWTALFEEILAFTRERVRALDLAAYRQRVRYWAAVSLLRCLMSSPAAAVVALNRRTRGAVAAEERDEDEYRRDLLDNTEGEGAADFVPEGVLEQAQLDLPDSERRRLLSFARRAEELRDRGDDPKLAVAVRAITKLLEEGYRPIVYCRFVPTAQYVADRLKDIVAARYPTIDVRAVTGEFDDEEREAMVKDLSSSARRILVATDCLSEGVNLQEHFDAVVHYDLPWNPNRLEQREGRVDRYGQKRATVQTVLLYGVDNPMDGAVLEVLIRKAVSIRHTLGISVPVPEDSSSVLEAVVSSLLLQDRRGQQTFDFARPEFHARWDRLAEREKESRTKFAQHGIRPDEVAAEIKAMDDVLGDSVAVRSFVVSACQRLGVPHETRARQVLIDLTHTDLIEDRRWKRSLSVAFDDPAPDDVEVVRRHHPVVAALCAGVLSEAFAATEEGRVSRCGAAYTDAVGVRTALVLLRIRYRLKERGGERFAEEVVGLAFERRGGQLVWHAANSPEVEHLLETTRVTANMTPEEKRRQVEWVASVLEQPESLSHLRAVASQRARELEDSHLRLRRYTGGGKLQVHPYDPDILGVYVYLPRGGSAR